MFWQRITHYPAIGKAPELRAHLEEQVKNAQANGAQTVLSTRVAFGDGPEFVESTRFENLAAYEKQRDQALASADFRNAGVKSAPLRRRTIKNELFKVLIRRSGGTAPRRYATRALFYPAPGKAREVRSILEEMVRSYQTERPYLRLLQQIFAPEGGQVYALGDSYENLMEYENLMDKRPASFYEAVVRASELSRLPSLQELHEVLIAWRG
jgi:hypothetical protein